MNDEDPSVFIKNKSNITDYNRKANLLQNTLYFLVLIVIITSLTYPWISSRIVAKESITKIYSEHLRAHAGAISTGVSEFLKQYEVGPRFLHGIRDSPGLIECSETKVKQFISFCQATRSHLDPKPNLFFLGESKKSFCFIIWTDPDSTTLNDFDFYYARPNSQGKFERYKFNGISTDFKLFNVEGGDDKTIIDEEEIFVTKTYDNFLWRNFQKIANVTMPMYTLGGAIFKNDTDTDSIVVAGTGVGLSHLVSNVRKIASTTESKYLFITTNDTILFNERTLYKPLSNSIGLPYYVFPTFKEINDEFWTPVGDYYEDLKSGDLITITINETKYLFLMEDIMVRNITKYKLIVAFNLEKPISDMYFEITVIFIVSLGIVTIMFFITFYILKKTKHERSKKLKRVPNLEDEKFRTDVNAGSLIRSIHSLRELQLAFPEDQILNKISDHAIQNLANTKKTLFTCPARKDSVTGLKRFAPNEAPDPPYLMWRFATGNRLVKGQELNETFDWEKNSQDSKLFIKKFVSLIVYKGLLFKSIDPDSFVKFLVQMIGTEINPAHAALRLSSLVYLITGPLKNTIGSRIDTFCVALAVSLLHPVSAKQFSKRVKNIKFYQDMLDDMCPGNGEERTYIRETVRMLLMSADDRHVFDNIGELSVVSESSDFNIIENWEHHTIYMKCLVKFCDFAAYWAPSYVMSQALAAENDFSDKEPGFKGYYEYIVAAKIVLPLLTNFTNLVKMDEVSKTLYSNIDVLKRIAEIKE